MNRIAGILSFERVPVEPSVLDRMIGAMKFQVTDGQNAWIEGEIGLGCALIGKIAGADIETSPYRHPNGQWVITFDGRIDNRQEVMGILRPEQVAGSARVSDEEIVLAAYEKWELGCPTHLIGDFAFTIWDQKKHRLICVRDHFGVKP